MSDLHLDTWFDVSYQFDPPPEYATIWLSGLPPGPDRGPFYRGWAFVMREDPLQWRVFALRGRVRVVHRVDALETGSRLRVRFEIPSRGPLRFTLRLLRPLVVALVWWRSYRNQRLMSEDWQAGRPPLAAPTQ